MSKEVADALRKARAKIAEEKNWTQGEFARGKSGDGVRPESKYAVCWCAVGAILAVGFTYAPILALNSAIMENCPIFEYNDTHTHAEVLAAFDAAIAAEDATC